MARLVALVVSASGYGALADHNLQVIDMYRGMKKPYDGVEEFRLANNNLADVMGVLRYIHQEIIVEHVLPSDRIARKYDIDAIAHYRMKVRNPNSIMADEQKVPFGFGDFGAFDYGVATSDLFLENVVKDGDFVGVQRQEPQISAVLNFTYPWYWFSVNGDCPNLPWTCIPGSNHEECKSKEVPPVIPALCNPGGCAGKKDRKARECSATVEDESNWADCCLRYKTMDYWFVGKEIIKGGYCDEDVPTGKPGCVYSYDDLQDEDFTNLDELVGITKMDCGGSGERKCKDWLDWRQNCYDPDKKYKRQFQCDDCIPDGGWNVKIKPTEHCVEYDLDPRCQDSSPGLCADPRCQAVEEKEIGLDFWKGRCDVHANQRRGEAIAEAALGEAFTKQHLLVDEETTRQSASCSKSLSCTPNPNGGPYCTRLFGGVCTPCFIPGTEVPFGDPDNFPMCPLTILKEYGDQPTGTTCKSDDPLDLCCLYGIQPCREIVTDGGAADLSVRGYLVAIAKQDTAHMLTFAKHWVWENGGEVKHKDQLEEVAYWLWHIQPPPHPAQAWRDFQATLEASTAVEWKQTTTTTTTTKAAKPSPPKPPGDSGSDGTKAIAAVVVVIIVIGALLLAYRYMRMRQRGYGEDARDLQSSRF